MKNLAKKVLSVQDSKKRIICQNFFLKTIVKQKEVRESFLNMLTHYIEASYVGRNGFSVSPYLRSRLFTNN